MPIPLSRRRFITVAAAAAGLPLLLNAASPFAAFAQFADWLWHKTGETSGLTPEVLVDALFDYLLEQGSSQSATVRESLRADYQASGARASPICLRTALPKSRSAQALRTGPKISA